MAKIEAVLLEFFVLQESLKVIKFSEIRFLLTKNP